MRHMETNTDTSASEYSDWDMSDAHDAARWLAEDGITASVVNTGGNCLVVEAERSDGFVVWASDASGDWVIGIHNPAVDHHDDDIESPTADIATFVAAFRSALNDATEVV